MLLESTHPDVGKIFTDPWNTEDSKFKTKVGFLIIDFSSFLGSLETFVAISNCNQLFSEQQSTYRPIDCLFVLECNFALEWAKHLFLIISGVKISHI